RTAQFRTVICFKDGTETIYVHGVCPGKIIREERGEEGFGYDSIFVPDGYEQTFAQMGAELKNKLSHRGKAVAKLVKILKDY
ncbi:MAG: non-canonical purine NTP pyrophosphatase, partial [Candidatus Kapabacteria bacterium]|nr:non-canonical purine NTP pyrophosphatase [Candidatus Kapabacteria bacterium]